MIKSYLSQFQSKWDFVCHLSWLFEIFWKDVFSTVYLTTELSTQKYTKVQHIKLTVCHIFFRVKWNASSTPDLSPLKCFTFLRQLSVWCTTHNGLGMQQLLSTWSGTSSGTTGDYQVMSAYNSNMYNLVWSNMGRLTQGHRGHDFSWDWTSNLNFLFDGSSLLIILI